MYSPLYTVFTCEVHTVYSSYNNNNFIASKIPWLDKVFENQTCPYKKNFSFLTLCCHDLYISFANKTKITSHAQKLTEDYLKLTE